MATYYDKICFASFQILIFIFLALQKGGKKGFFGKSINLAPTGHTMRKKISQDYFIESGIVGSFKGRNRQIDLGPQKIELSNSRSILLSLT